MPSSLIPLLDCLVSDLLFCLVPMPCFHNFFRIQMLWCACYAVLLGMAAIGQIICAASYQPFGAYDISVVKLFFAVEVICSPSRYIIAIYIAELLSLQLCKLFISRVSLVSSLPRTHWLEHERSTSLIWRSTFNKRHLLRTSVLISYFWTWLFSGR